MLLGKRSVVPSTKNIYCLLVSIFVACTWHSTELYKYCRKLISFVKIQSGWLHLTVS